MDISTYETASLFVFAEDMLLLLFVESGKPTASAGNWTGMGIQEIGLGSNKEETPATQIIIVSSHPPSPPKTSISNCDYRLWRWCSEKVQATDR
jgi:hypothetical protein